MTQQLRIGGVPEHFNLPWQQAIEDGAFEAEGVHVEFTEFPGGTGAMTAALAANEIDAALLLTEGAVTDILRGSDNRLVSLYVDSPLIWGIHVPAASDIHDVEAIEGRRYAISRLGSGSHLIAIVDAADRGFSIPDSEFEIVGTIDGARKAFEDGTAEVFLWEKHMTQPLVDAGEFRRVGECVVPWPAFVVSARRDYLVDHASAIDTALEIVRPYTERLKSGEDSVQLISETYGIEPDDVRSWLAHVQWSRSSDCPEDALKRVVDALKSQGIVESDAESDVSDLWYETDEI